jgi:hypothetical protein
VTSAKASSLFFTEKRGSAIENSVSLVSQMFHLVTFLLRKPKTHFDSAMLIFSVDVDAGAGKLGLVNGGKNDANVHNCFSEFQIGEVEERALPVFVDAFNTFGVPATFAIRGQIVEIGSSVIEPLLDSPVKHDIGAHGYSHRSFRTLTKAEAEDELNKISNSLTLFRKPPESFVFPRNIICHLDLLEKFKYKCYREASEGLLGDRMYIEKKGKLHNIQPSLYLNQSVTPFILERILDVAIAKKAPLHLWFHLWTFGLDIQAIEKYVKNVFSPFLKYAQIKKKNGVLTFETMLSAAEKAERSLVNKS